MPRFHGGPVRVLSAEETGGRYSLTEFRMAPPPVPGPPPHIHEDSDEAIYVLEGTLQMEVGGQPITATPGAVVLAPKGTLHALANAGSDAARFLVILSPPGYEGFWREMGELRAAGGPDGAPPSAEVVLALQRKYHLATGGEVRLFE
ncbi:MAG: cupin domain-containing protein [Chloroflexi bacterium]|nr:cupin domain-containing protein [Chloroflexota bacterium]